MTFPLEKKKLYTVDMRNNRINRQEMNWTLYNMRPKVDEPIYDALREIYREKMRWGNSNWNRILVEKGDYKGTWVKRFAKYLRDEKKIKLDNGTAGIIGDAIAPIITEIRTFFEIDNYGGWQAGAFGEHLTSCYFGTGCYSNFRLKFLRKGGMSVLFYASEEEWEKNRRRRGIGRCWLCYSGGNCYIFNAYGRYKLPVIAKMLAKEAGWQAKQVNLIIEDGFTNGGKGWEIYKDHSNVYPDQWGYKRVRIEM